MTSAALQGPLPARPQAASVKAAVLLLCRRPRRSAWTRSLSRVAARAGSALFSSRRRLCGKAVRSFTKSASTLSSFSEGPSPCSPEPAGASFWTSGPPARPSSALLSSLSPFWRPPPRHWARRGPHLSPAAWSSPFRRKSLELPFGAQPPPPGPGSAPWTARFSCAPGRERCPCAGPLPAARLPAGIGLWGFQA